MTHKRHRIYLEVKDLQILTNRSRAHCYKLYQSYRDLSGQRRVTIQKYCELEGIEDDNLVYKALGIEV